MKLASSFPRRRLAACLALALAAACGTIQAQDNFPSRPIKIVVGSEAGSGAAIIGATTATPLSPGKR